PPGAVRVAGLRRDEDEGGRQDGGQEAGQRRPRRRHAAGGQKAQEQDDREGGDQGGKDFGPQRVVILRPGHGGPAGSRRPDAGPRRPPTTSWPAGARAGSASGRTPG